MGKVVIDMSMSLDGFIATDGWLAYRVLTLCRLPLAGVGCPVLEIRGRRVGDRSVSGECRADPLAPHGPGGERAGRVLGGRGEASPSCSSPSQPGSTLEG